MYIIYKWTISSIAPWRFVTVGYGLKYRRWAKEWECYALLGHNPQTHFQFHWLNMSYIYIYNIGCFSPQDHWFPHSNSPMEDRPTCQLVCLGCCRKEFLDDPTSSCFAWWTWLFLKLGIYDSMKSLFVEEFGFLNPHGWWNVPSAMASVAASAAGTYDFSWDTMTFLVLQMCHGKKKWCGWSVKYFWRPRGALQLQVLEAWDMLFSCGFVWKYGTPTVNHILRHNCPFNFFFGYIWWYMSFWNTAIICDVPLIGSVGPSPQEITMFKEKVFIEVNG